MPRFHPLTVTDIRKTIPDAVAVTLEPQNGADFSFIPGQYLTFRRELGGAELRRSYSICTGLDDGALRVGIKRVEGGVFSSWANEEMQPGDVLQAMLPQGRFHAPLEPELQKSYLFFAGGSGITPVLSILRTVLKREPEARATLVYANRSLQTIMFREELEALKNLHIGRLQILHILENDVQDIDLFAGRVDREKCDRLFSSLIDIGSVDWSFICGPKPMMTTIAEALAAHGLAEDRIKYELFASDQPGRAKAPAASRPQAEARAATLQVTLDGVTQDIAMAAGQTVLEAVEAAGLDAPFSCKAGVCCTCRAKLISGKAEMDVNHALEDYEVRAGYVLTCQARPTTEALRVDYDQH
ncbi:MAG: 2Fe-2S iron-sulfur cluster-binding protein [Pseudomonadota bacterium]